MNGAVKEYRLNDPVGWDEFKAWPDDIKVLYIKSLRKAYNVSDTHIAKMLGVGQSTFNYHTKRLGVKPTRTGKEVWDADGWYAWVNGVPVAAKEEADEVPVIEEKLEKCDEEVLEQAEKCDCTEERAIPGWGQMELEGTVAECVKTLDILLNDRRVKLAVSWTVVE